MSKCKFDYDLLANDLRAFMTKNDLTLRDMAVLTEWSFATINRLTRYGQIHNIEMLIDVCEWLETHPSKYFREAK